MLSLLFVDWWSWLAPFIRDTCCIAGITQILVSIPAKPSAAFVVLCIKPNISRLAISRNSIWQRSDVVKPRVIVIKNERVVIAVQIATTKRCGKFSEVLVFHALSPVR
ncbi:hypothetical protein AE621_10420 [Acidovorax sp. SD340]|nr:hypothetical protein AE621_10420 [Acidovorax sp. SD340]